LGVTDADHEESSPNASVKLITRLSCSLVGQERQVRITPGSQADNIYKKDEAAELFACNYGVNEAFTDQIQSKELRFSGYDYDGTARMAELPGHPFFISTLFVPQSKSRSRQPHPLIVAYLQAALRYPNSEAVNRPRQH
jgi:CTP synthase (UTP-ammonia lyase)